jgi:hypothetical protein
MPELLRRVVSPALPLKPNLLLWAPGVRQIVAHIRLREAGSHLEAYAFSKNTQSYGGIEALDRLDGILALLLRWNSRKLHESATNEGRLDYIV